MLRVVLDTDIIVAAFASAAGASRRLLLAVLDEHTQLLLSAPLLFEYEAVLTRPEVLAMSRLTREDVLTVLEELTAVCVPVSTDYRWRPLAHDPDDDLVLEAAINGGADVIATFNVKDMAEGAGQFGIPVERPGTVVRRLGQQ
jgi:putative PIN family toxin of toxin-antitoxin system